jgi:hypothetical protein
VDIAAAIADQHARELAAGAAARLELERELAQVRRGGRNVDAGAPR